MATLNYKHLRYFWMVAKSGSIARASAQLHLTPQSISGQLSEFEGSLGVKLFRRVGRGLELTETEAITDSARLAGVLQRLKAEPVTSAVPVVVVSADATPGQVRRFAALGADEYLAKPLDIIELLELLGQRIEPASRIDLAQLGPEDAAFGRKAQAFIQNVDASLHMLAGELMADGSWFVAVVKVV